MFHVLYPRPVHPSFDEVVPSNIILFPECQLEVVPSVSVRWGKWCGDRPSIRIACVGLSPLQSRSRLAVSNFSLLSSPLPTILPGSCMRQWMDTSVCVSSLPLACYMCSKISSLRNTSYYCVQCVTG
jgi:hypothetical protein